MPSHLIPCSPLEDGRCLHIEVQPSGNIVYVDQQPGFAHLDFTWAVDANVKVYDKVTALLKQYLK